MERFLNSYCSLLKEPGLKEVTVAAGWDVVQQHKSFIRRILDPVQDYDLDLVHYLLDCNDNITSIIYYANKRENGIKLNITYIKRDVMYRIGTSSTKTFINLYELIHKDAKYSLSRKANKINHYVNTEVT